MNDFDVVVIGGGISGLVAAYELVKRNKKVVLVEKEDELGGLIKPLRNKEYSIEGIYHQLFKQDRYIKNIAKEIGININYSHVKVGYKYKDKIHEFSRAIDIIGFGNLSLVDKYELIKFIVKIMFTKDILSYDKINAKKWIIKNAGPHVYYSFFEPLIKSKFGDNYENVSAAWVIGRIKLRAGGILQKETLGYPEKGFGRFIDKMSGYIVNKGGLIIKGSEVKKIRIEEESVKGVYLGKIYIKAKSVISTISPTKLNKIVRFEKEYRQKIGDLECQRCICIILGVKKKLTDYFWVNIMNEECSFDALIEQTNFQPYSSYNENILYLASYPNNDSKLWDMKEAELSKRYIRSLESLFPKFDKKDINWFKVYKEEAGLIYKEGLKSNLPDLTTPIKGLFLCGMMCSYPDRRIDEVARVARKSIECCIKFLSGN